MPADRPDLLGIVPILEPQSLKKSGHCDFLRKKHAGMQYFYVMYHLKDWS